MPSTGRTRTDRGARYGKQLAAHLGRRHGSEWSEEEGSGTITFGEGTAVLRTSPDELVITVTGADLDQLEDVVERHLVRFGERDELSIQWTRSAD
jgi:hypothetical protein